MYPFKLITEYKFGVTIARREFKSELEKIREQFIFNLPIKRFKKF